MKTTNHIYRIVAFLLFTVGIIYIVVWFQHTRISEGFQSVLICPMGTIAGKETYLCNTPDEASALMTNVLRRPDVPVCYTDKTNVNLNLSTANIHTNVYTCYDIHGDPIFDSRRGVYVPFDPIENNDPMPQNGEQDAATNYTSFTSGYNTFLPAYVNTSTLQYSASTFGYVNAINVQSNLYTLSNLKCTGTIAPAYLNACDAISHAISVTNGFVSDTSSNSLQGINTLLMQSKNDIKGQLYNNFMPGFYNSDVMSAKQKADYLSNK